jgi:hypothetical protein
MKKNDLMKMGLTDEQVQSIIELYHSSLKGYVPKTRLDEVIDERNALRIYIGEQDKKISMLEKVLTNSEELQMQNNQMQTEYEIMKAKLEQAKNSFKVAIEMIL